MSGKITRSLIDRLMDRVEFTPDGCWTWRGALMNTGYGRIGLRGKSYYTHRVCYEHFVGVIPDDRQLRSPLPQPCLLQSESPRARHTDDQHPARPRLVRQERPEDALPQGS
jgi:hypothetical protein